MRSVQAIIIGAGQAGLAMSHCLGRHGIDHVVLERGRVAERWRTERWDSLRLLTPNWMSRLPGWSYQGHDPDGYMAMPEVVEFLSSYSRLSRTPLEAGTDVLSVRRVPGGYQVATSRGTWAAGAVVVATGHCGHPAIPAMARCLPSAIGQVTPSDYRRPSTLADGGVLVVGASATGVQLAEEIHRSGRPVTLSVGSHTRLPRTYRGRDIMWWMDRIGVLDERAGDVPNLQRARTQPSLQLVGSVDRRSIDLDTLRKTGLRIVGRAIGVEGGLVHLRDDLAETTTASQGTLARLLARIDAAVPDANGQGRVEAAALLRPVAFEPAPPALDLAADGIRTVLWATGYRRSYGWLRVPEVLDASGEIIHRDGVTAVPGLCVLGLRFLRRRKSSFLDGVGGDAEAIAKHLIAQLTSPRRVAA
ncbi:NAD(P)-binding domain-containing protein [Sabulicella glaciei]|uniref:NAD(P)-binding domain-containing protein n=1 Tax=Sabulicella glaciei TaxID=2984948 RepID=A0ABT3NS80_9PROT|nr:NAD(P)-binding domain-containing protein [Roseococcus sp. MDT2-1-1]MCW8085021.1 NAD(P)-binding domain-containing protein [Roseococcus sp. MDT2-1-1]